MAKEKKNKTDDKTSKKSKGGGGEFAKPSEAPASGGDSWRLEVEDHLGDLFMITPLREITTKGFEDKDTDVIVANIVHLNEKKPERSEEHEEVYVWAGWIKGSLRGYIGEQRVLGRLAQDKAKGRGSNAAWVLEDADNDDVEVAKDYLTFINNPLNSKNKGSEKKSKADDEKPAKKKKSKK